VSRGAGTPKEQQQRKQAQLARAQQDQTYSRQVFGTWPPPTTAAPARSATASGSGSGTARTSPGQRRRRKKADLDVAYRQALGLNPDQPLPGALGQVDPRHVDAGQVAAGGAGTTAAKGGRAAGGGKGGTGKGRKPRGRNGSSATQRASRPGRTAVSAITCPTCKTTIAKGTPIATWDQQVMHPACRDALQAKAKTLAGVTFRGHKPSDWRLGSSPSNGPA
jgi:hypothetical protein